MEESAPPPSRPVNKITTPAMGDYTFCIYNADKTLKQTGIANAVYAIYVICAIGHAYNKVHPMSTPQLKVMCVPHHK